MGAGPLLMRHGLTLGELAKWFLTERRLDLDLHLVAMEGYDPHEAPGFGWPLTQLSWVNPSPNAASLNMARCFPGTVLLEGTTLSEGRGTTVPLELLGAPDIDFNRVLDRAEAYRTGWTEGALIRPCWFAPTFHKHADQLCSGLQLHTDNRHYQHTRFRPYRLIALLLKCIREEYADYPLWRAFPYEYETERLAIDLLAGGTDLRAWVDDRQSGPGDLERRLLADEERWAEETQALRLYP